jgi:hypothetical protein
VRRARGDGRDVSPGDTDTVVNAEHGTGGDAEVHCNAATR